MKKANSRKVVLMALAFTIAAPSVSVQAESAADRASLIAIQNSQMSLALSQLLTMENLSAAQIEALSAQIVDLMDREKGLMASLKFTNTGVLVQNVERLRTELETLKKSGSSLSERELQVRLLILEKALTTRLGELNSENRNTYLAVGATLGVAIGVVVGARGFMGASGNWASTTQALSIIKGGVVGTAAAITGAGIAFGIASLGKTDAEAVQGLLD